MYHSLLDLKPSLTFYHFQELHPISFTVSSIIVFPKIKKQLVYVPLQCYGRIVKTIRMLWNLTGGRQTHEHNKRYKVHLNVHRYSDCVLYIRYKVHSRNLSDGKAPTRSLPPYPTLYMRYIPALFLHLNLPYVLCIKSTFIYSYGLIRWLLVEMIIYFEHLKQAKHAQGRN